MLTERYDTTETRDAHCKTYFPNSKCVQFDSLTKMNKAELREVFTEQKFVYVYHNQIDDRGDNAKSEMRFLLLVKKLSQKSRLL